MKQYPFENLVIFKSEHFKIWQDWEVPIAWFFIISPSRKMRSIADFTKDESYEFVNLLIKTRTLMKEKLNINDVYIFQNEDTEHGFHLWVFPRLNWMESFWRKIESVRPILKYAQENMFTEDNIKQVNEYAKKMKESF